jgi:hypothetical protein
MRTIAGVAAVDGHRIADAGSRAASLLTHSEPLRSGDPLQHEKHLAMQQLVGLLALSEIVRFPAKRESHVH